MSNFPTTTTRTTSFTPIQQQLFQLMRLFWVIWAVLIAVVTFAAVPFYQAVRIPVFARQFERR